jgi:hypothetical protein
MNRTCKPSRISRGQPVIEGAGVHLKRAFGHAEAPAFDPFLLLDDFRSDHPDFYLKGFPWHPHRGIETITYMLDGVVNHGDSLGNTGTIGSGDVQWMTAGSGIVHQEMPQGDASGKMGGFQLWANLPARNKMMAPRYQEIRADQIPEILLEEGVRIKVVCGRIGDVQGPVTDIVTDPEYLDVFVPARKQWTHPVQEGYTVLAYGVEGPGGFGHDSVLTDVQSGSLVAFEEGDHIVARAGDEAFRFLLVSGRPIGEPVAWRGPIVMNTEEELALAFQEYREGTFIKHGD